MNDNTDDTLHGFEDIEALLRESTVGDAELFEPPSEIWAAIEASITVPDTALRDTALRDTALPDTALPDPVPAVAPSPPPVSGGPGATVTHLADRRRPGAWLGAVAAAAVLVVAGAFVFNAVRSESSNEPVLARAQLTWDATAFDPLGADATATAELVGGDAGYTIDLDEAGLPDLTVEGEQLELWLIQPDVDNNPVALVSLGTLDTRSAATAASFDVPDGFDPDEYFVVDISVEPSDGNPDHSGRSILRGPLVQA